MVINPYTRSRTTELKTDIPNKKEYRNTNITHNEMRIKCKNKQLYKNKLNSADGYKQDNRNKSCIFETNKYSHLEKKIFKELDYVDFLRNNRAISYKTYKQIICKKYELRIVLPLLLLMLLSVSLLLDLLCSCGLVRGFLKVLKILGVTGAMRISLGKWLLSIPPLKWLLISAKHVKFEKVTNAGKQV
ncbi:Plasmodium exported protein (Pm-fam-a like), unknown function [Plasmodium malariae]|uniref:Fam-l protein n=1 Tax=Plasmodium malariae TaxID=5858 RepID=A0A1A8XD33_PLAMA|nr:Plasmodium exported protein (Pm-fam-a like), unknown function [Plasmodium malariae]